MAQRERLFQLLFIFHSTGKTWDEKVSIFRDYHYQYFYHFFNRLSRDLDGGATFYGGAQFVTDAIKGKGTSVAIVDQWMKNRPRGINFGMMVHIFQE